MHLFLYKAPRHETPAYYRRNKLVQGTYRNDFDLDLIKGGIKGRYTIQPHGANEFQARLKDFGLESEFYGHIIEVPEAKNAVWFKLNYDNIGKAGTNFVGSWRHLDVNELAQYDQPYKDANQKLTTLNLEHNRARYNYSSMSGYLNNRDGFSRHMSGVQTAGEAYLNELKLAMNSISKEQNKLVKTLERIRENIRDYMKSRQF